MTIAQNFCTQHVLLMFCKKRRASDKDLPVQTATTNGKKSKNRKRPFLWPKKAFICSWPKREKFWPIWRLKLTWWATKFGFIRKKSAQTFLKQTCYAVPPKVEISPYHKLFAIFFF